jgi:hypothetical protein
VARQITEHFLSLRSFYCAHRAENNRDEGPSTTVNNLEIAGKVRASCNKKLVKLGLRRQFSRNGSRPNVSSNKNGTSKPNIHLYIRV